MKVCVVGLGTIGTPVANYIYRMREQELEVYGFDLVERPSINMETFTDWNEVPNSDVYLITVPSINVEEACQKINQKKSLVSVESTVGVGTCRRISKNFGLKNLVHCPHRYWNENPMSHGVRQLRVIGGLNKTGLKKGLDFYHKLRIPTYICSSIEVAEICKTAENAYRFVQIAFVEELRIICSENNLPFEEVRNACNSKWNIELLEARDGIKGVCLPQDIRFLKSLASSSPLLDGAIATDDLYQSFIRVMRLSKCL